jgi:hypothetical protein
MKRINKIAEYAAELCKQMKIPVRFMLSDKNK